MSILDIEEYDSSIPNSTPTPVVVDRKFRNNEETKSSILFADDKELDSVIQYISGMQWSIDYFVQVRDVNDDVKLPDINTPATIQKYNRINNLVIYLQTTIDQTDPNDISGEAIINAGFIPNYGDAFKAVLTGGREAIFVIDEISKNNYNLHDAYRVTFKAYAFLDTDDTIYRDITFKTIKEYYYDKTSFLDYSAPVVIKQEYIDKLNLRNQYEDLLNLYIDNMLSNEHHMILLPTLNEECYDQYLFDFIIKTMDLNKANNSYKLNRVSVDKDIKDTVWDVIIDRNPNKLKYCNKNMGFSKLTTYNPKLYNINYLGVKYAILDSDSKLDITTLTYRDDLYTENKVVITSPLYVFSSDFYDNISTGVSLIEEVLLNYINHKVNTTDNIKTLIDDYRNWCLIEQYYLGPVLAVIIKDAIQNSFKSI